MLNLVTDRAGNAPDVLKSLNQKKHSEMTGSESALWDAGNGGSYDYNDLNRVELAVEALSDELDRIYREIKASLAFLGVADDSLFSIPYSPENLVFDTKTDWTETDIPSAAEMSRYIKNIYRVCSSLEYSRPPLPNTMDGLGIDGANNIEKALQELEVSAAAFETTRKNQIDRTANSWYYSGELYGGERA